MPSRATLPQAYEIYANIACDRSRPPWACIATPELAIDYLGVHPQTLWNYTLRRQGPEVESDAKRLYRQAGRRNLYRYEAVLSWLPGGEAYVDRPWHWTRLWASSALGESVADDADAVLALIARLEETDLTVKSRPYAFRRLEPCIARLRTAYGC
jgi:hypothetical protein